ncbi:MAG: hypothetical protein WCH04_04210, partial [Gammaproteobacteria bacterium]
PAGGGVSPSYRGIIRVGADVADPRKLCASVNTIIQRKDAKFAKKIFNEINLTLCILSAIAPCVA